MYSIDENGAIDPSGSVRVSREVGIAVVAALAGLQPYPWREVVGGEDRPELPVNTEISNLSGVSAQVAARLESGFWAECGVQDRHQPNVVIGAMAALWRPWGCWRRPDREISIMFYSDCAEISWWAYNSEYSTSEDGWVQTEISRKPHRSRFIGRVVDWAVRNSA